MSLSINAQVAYAIIDAHRGEFISVTFVKRTTGDERTMHCRSGVRKYTTGGELAFEPTERGLYLVWDLEKEGYRFIDLNTVFCIRAGGRTYTMTYDFIKKTLDAAA